MMNYRFACGRLDSNHHGTQQRGQPWNQETIKGPKFTFVRLEGFDRNSRLKTRIGWRIWFYFPSGACWNFDLYKRESGAKA